jgi:L-ascorbate metabolism protein UlaG (beta-lactamase superfamily)
MNRIKISQVVNAGVLIETNNKKILIDGIHCTNTYEWSFIDEKLMNQIIYTNKDFHNINLLLFSHQHCDHFNKEKTFEYIENNHIEKLAICDLCNEELNNYGILEELKTDFHEEGTIDADDIKVKYFKTKHLKDEQFGINHYSFIINIKNINILYMADADFNKKELFDPLWECKIDVIIAPFIIATYKSGKNFINEINPTLLILNHLPKKEDDKYNYRILTEKSIVRNLSDVPESVIFQEFNDSVIIYADNDNITISTV